MFRCKCHNCGEKFWYDIDPWREADQSKIAAGFAMKMTSPLCIKCLRRQLMFMAEHLGKLAEQEVTANELGQDTTAELL